MNENILKENFYFPYIHYHILIMHHQPTIITGFKLFSIFNLIFRQDNVKPYYEKSFYFERTDCISEKYDIGENLELN